MKWGGEVSRIAFPILMGMIPDSIVSLVGMITASRIGTEALAGTGLASYLFMIINAVTSVFMVGLLVITSQAYGGNNIGLIERVFGEAITTSILFSIMVIATSPFWLPTYVSLLSGGQEIVSVVAMAYLSSRILSIPALMLNSVIATLFRAVEKPWPPTYSSISVGVASSVLVPSLTLGYLGLPELGIPGMGLASAISQYAGLFVYVFLRPPVKIRMYVPSKITVKMLAVGIPASVERFVGSAGHNIYINAVAKSGISALAAHNIGLSMENLIIGPVFAVNIAASTKAGHHVGANNIEDLDRVTKEAVKIGVVWMSVATAILIGLSPFAGAFFTSDEEVIKLVTIYLIMAAVSEIGLGASQALYGIFRGMGSTWVPLAISSITILLFRAALAQTLQPIYGVYGVWFTQITDMYGRLLISYLIYVRLKSRLLVKVV
ncbi:MAG: MATE family efflux transporter [Desulfurococcaceae archaeon TW002]